MKKGLFFTEYEIEIILSMCVYMRLINRLYPKEEDIKNKCERYFNEKEYSKTSTNKARRREERPRK